MSSSIPNEPPLLGGAMRDAVSADGVAFPFGTDGIDARPDHEFAAGEVHGLGTRPSAAWIASESPSFAPEIPAAFDFVGRVLMAPNADTARHFAAHLIAEYFQADFVVLGKSTRAAAPCEATAICGDRLPAPERSGDIEAALGETLATGRHHLSVPQSASPGENASGEDVCPSTLASLAHRQLARALGGQRVVLSVPLISTSDQAVGALLVVWSPTSDGQAHRDVGKRLRFLQHIADPLSDCLNVLDRVQPGALQQKIDRFKQKCGRRQRLWLVAIAAAIVLIGLVPVRYPVRADVTLQPKMRRFIASPIDAPLKEAHVQPGQRVRRGDLLVTLDAEQTRSRLTVLQADADRALSERAGHLASSSLGEAELARLKAARLRGEIEQLQQHMQRTEIYSPIDGVVLGDELKPLEGAPLKTGQTLCEVAPLDHLVAELEIPPDQILHVAAGQFAKIRLEAAGELEALPIARLHPQAEPNAAGKYRFHARVDVVNSTDELKPGMQGIAMIETDRHPLAWCLFQRLWQRIRTWS